jgi:hypothetical protein
MIDFWFTIGAAVEDPGFLTAIAQAAPAFNAMPATLSIGGQNIPLPLAGRLVQASTTFVRQKIRDYLLARYGGFAPVISLYTAGKVCQLWNMKQQDVVVSTGLANTAFKAVTATQHVSLSQPLLTIMGACLIDPNLSLAFQQQQNLSIASEFGVIPSINSVEWRVVQGWLNDPHFQPAQNRLLTSWAHPCHEVMLWYPDFEDAAN